MPSDVAKLYQTAMPDPERKDIEAYGDVKRLATNYRTILRKAGKLVSYQEMFSDDNLREMSLDYAVGTLGKDADHGALKRSAIQKYQELQRKRDGEIAANQSAIKNAIDAGALYNTADITDIELPYFQALNAAAKEAPVDRAAVILSQREDLWTPEERALVEQYKVEPPDPEMGTVSKVMHGIGTGGRMMQSGLAEGIKEFREQGKEEFAEQMGQKEPEDIGTARRIALAGAGQLARAMGPLGAVASPDVHLGLSKIVEHYPTEAAEGLNAGIEAAQQAVEKLESYMPQGKLGSAMRLMAAPATLPLEAGMASVRALPKLPTGDTVLGVPRDIAAETLRDPVKMGKTLGRAGEGVLAGVSFDKRTALTDTLEEIARELGPEFSERDLVSVAIKHPVITQLAAEIGLDPINAIGGLIPKIMGKGVGAAKATRVGRAVAESKPMQALGKARDVFTWRPEAAALQRKGMEGQASLMRLAESEGRIPAQKIGELEQRLGTIKRVAKSPEDRALLQQALDGKLAQTREETMWKLPDHLREAFDESVRLGDELYDLGIETGSLRKWTAKGQLEEPTKRELYVPHREMTDEGKALIKRQQLEREIPQFAEGQSKAQLMQKAALSRKAPDEAFVQDPAVQFKKSLDEAKLKMPATREIQKLDEYLSGDLIHKVPRGKNAGEKLANKIDELNKATPGTEWGHLDKEARDTYVRLTGRKGTKIGKHNIVAPKEVIQRINELMPLIGGTPTKIGKAAKAMDTFAKVAIRPTMLAFRTGATVLGGIPYLARNTAGALGLGGLAHGVRVLNPNLQSGAIRAALASAGFIGDDAARAMKFVTRTGNELSIGQVLDLANRAGIVDQHRMRMALDVGGGTTRKILDAVTGHVTPFYTPSVTGKLSVRNLAKLSEDYQHLIAFMGFLDDTSSKGLAKAMDLTARFAGDYKRLSPFEKYVMKDIVGFYSWNRFIWPHIMRQFAENPQRLAAFAKGRGYFERKFEGPKDPGLLPSYLQLSGVPAPPSYKPPSRLPALGTDAHAMMAIEDPTTMGLAWLPMLKGSGQWGEDLSMQLGPVARFASEMAWGRDMETGEKIDRFPDLDAELFAGEFDWIRTLQKSQQNAVGKLLLSAVQRPSRNLMDLWQLYYRDAGKPADAIDIALRYRAGNNARAMAWVLNQLLEREETGAIVPPPGTFVYPHFPEREAARKSARALATERSQERQYQRGTPK